MQTDYLYGDATPCPLKLDVIALLPDAIEFAVRGLICQARIDDATDDEVRFAATTEEEMEKLQALGANLIATIDRATAGEGESPVARCAALLRQGASDLIQRELDVARARMAEAKVNAHETASNERAAFAEAFNALVLRHPLPDADEIIEIVEESPAGYKACLRARTSYGLDWTTELEIPPSHTLGRILKLERVIERVEIHVREAGWLQKAPKLRTRRLDRFCLSQLVVGSKTTTGRLRSSSSGEGDGFYLTFGDAPTQVQIAHVLAGDAPDGLSCEVTPDDSRVLEELHQQLRSMAIDLLRHKAFVVDAGLDGAPLTQLTSPRTLVERIIASLVPLVQPIARRSLDPGELVLKRLVADNQREELFVSKAALYEKIQSLPIALQRVFEPLDLSGAVQGAEPFALLGKPGHRAAISVPAPSHNGMATQTQPLAFNGEGLAGSGQTAPSNFSS